MKTILYLSLGLILVASACKKEEGEGGKFTITGKVFVRQYNSTWQVQVDSFYAQNEKVYIIYGDDVTYGDDQNTNSDGTYEFKFLRKGNYKVYTYSDTLNTVTQRKMVKSVDVHLGSEKTVTLPDLIIYNNN
jgi:hypothetical protein